MNKDELRKFFSDFRYLTSSDDPNTLKEFVKYDEVRKLMSQTFPSDEYIYRIFHLGLEYMNLNRMPNISIVEYIKQNLNEI